MGCLGFEPGLAGWKEQKNPLSYGGTPRKVIFTQIKCSLDKKQISCTSKSIIIYPLSNSSV